ncbi:MAG: peptidoglycan-binding domain-containing protein [Verrucomicrobiota bacterium]
MKKLFLCSAFAVALAIPSLHADDSVRSAQTILQSAGYYTGSVDGELNAETKAALRRYQIRNQLVPSGELTAETVAALNKEGQSVAAATPAPQPTAVAPTLPPPAPAPPHAVQGVPISESAAYDKIFARTPSEKAAVENQAQTLRKAQILLAERGLFRGVTDGRPGPETEEALLRFQALRELPRTGRLDIDTLAELHLLPVGKLQRHEVRPPYEPQVPRGAVRGVPLD